MAIKEKTKVVKEFLKSHITKDMKTEDIEKYQQMIQHLDDIDGEEDTYTKEISDCKDKIVSLIKNEGSANPPQDEQEKQPRSLKEIAESISKDGGK